MGDMRQWTPTGATGKQNAGTIIEAAFVNPLSASLQMSLRAHGELEAHWDEEAGSEVEASAGVDFVVDVENREELDYILTIKPRELRASSSGAAKYVVSIFLSGTGCDRDYSIPWYVNFSGADGSKENRSERGARRD